jgi:hypothetical protein
MVSEDYDLLAEDVSADAVAAAQIGAPEGVRLTAEQRAELLRRRSVQGRLTQLDKAIDGQYERILRDNVSVNKSITDWCQNMLAEARTIVMNRQVDKLPKAEWNVQQVRARLDRAEESARQASRYALPIIIWGAAWFAVFVFLLFNPTFIFELLRIGEGDDPFLVAEVFLSALYFGGIGGVAAVFYHLFKYVSQRSFDNQYVLSFFGKPFMGMILGSMIYLTVFVVMRVLGLAPVGLQPAEAQNVPLLTTDVMYLAILYFVAMAAGFKENLAFDLLNRVIKAVLGGDRDEKSAQTPPETAPAS